MTNTLETIIRNWTRIGGCFTAEPSEKTPDLEFLLLDTARVASKEARLLPVAFSWLYHYWELVAKQRLANLVMDDLEEEFRPVLGLLLESVQDHLHTSHFKGAIALCSPAPQANPLLEFQRSSPGLYQLAQRQASDVSRKWCVWAEELEPKLDVIRPLNWVLQHNPGYELRVMLGGDLRASIMETLHCIPQAGSSEMELGRHVRASRDALRKALAHLERWGLIQRAHSGRALEVRAAP